MTISVHRGAAWLAVVVMLAAGCAGRSARNNRRVHREPTAPTAAAKDSKPILAPGADIIADEVIPTLSPEPPNVFAAPVKGPWADAKVGDFAKYRAAGDMTMTYKVVQADADSVTVEITASAGGQDATQQAAYPRLVPGRAHEGIPPDASWREENLTVAGRALPCRVAAWRKDGGDRRTLKVYLSSLVPGEMVRSVATDSAGKTTVALDLTEFGR